MECVDMETSLVYLLFPGILNHMISPASPYQYSQRLRFNQNDIEELYEYMTQICEWCCDNFKDRSWHITEIAVDHEDKMYFDFDFANVEDQMAFKLRWT